MVILAVDPGYDRLGVAVLEKKMNKENIVFSECFETDRKLSFHKRLGQIGFRIREIIDTFSIDVLVVESLFFSKNTKTALKVSEAKGVIVFQAVDKNIPVYEYTPNQIKVAVGGHGRAAKEDLRLMVQRLVFLNKKKRFDDEIDAIALGLTFFATNNNKLL